MDPFVLQHLKGVSRTYAIVIPMLPGELDDAVGLAYLLMRVVDTLEDAAELSDERRRADLLALDAILASGGGDLPAGPMDELARPIGDVAAERELMAVLPEVLRRIDGLRAEYCGAIRGCARKMIGGVLEILDRAERIGRAYPAVRDSGELRQYCYYVAGVVGEMLCEMMAHYLRTPALTKLRDVAVELGIGLQLVNILKDALKDSKQGRRYLPLTDDGRISPAEIYETILKEARTSLEKGAEFVLALPATAWQLRSFCGLPIAWGAMTIARAASDASRAKIGREAIRDSIEQFSRRARDDQALRAWLLGLLRQPRAAATPS
jgi:farnesyl-diphosphate farnesyltransferase